MYSDGTTDVTRTLHFGSPTSEQRDVYTRLLAGCISLATAVFPLGTTTSQLDILVRGELYKQGLDFGHGTTHGIGMFLGVHEGEHVSKLQLPHFFSLGNFLIFVYLFACYKL